MRVRDFFSTFSLMILSKFKNGFIVCELSSDIKFDHAVIERSTAISAIFNRTIRVRLRIAQFFFVKAAVKIYKSVQCAVYFGGNEILTPVNYLQHFVLRVFIRSGKYQPFVFIFKNLADIFPVFFGEFC